MYDGLLFSVNGRGTFEKFKIISNQDNFELLGI